MVRRFGTLCIKGLRLFTEVWLSWITENKDILSANNLALEEILQRDHLYKLKTIMDQEWYLMVLRQWILFMWRLDHWELHVIFSRLKICAKVWQNSLMLSFELIGKLYHGAKLRQMPSRCRRKYPKPHDLCQNICRSRVWWTPSDLWKSHLVENLNGLTR